MFARRFLTMLWLSSMLGSAGCTEQDKIQATNIQVVRKLNLYLNQHNWQAMNYCYADTVQRKDTSIQAYWSSKQACISRHRRLMAQYPDLRQRITQLYAAGGHHVMVEALAEGTTKSGQAFRQAYCIIYTVERQHITKEYHYESLFSATNF
jgi:hypothetical protein